MQNKKKNVWVIAAVFFLPLPVPVRYLFILRIWRKLKISEKKAKPPDQSCDFCKLLLSVPRFNTVSAYRFDVEKSGERCMSREENWFWICDGKYINFVYIQAVANNFPGKGISFIWWWI